MEPIEDGALNFLKLTIMMASNDMLASDPAVGSTIYEQLQQEHSRGLIEYLLSLKGPTAEALAESLFRLAVEAEDIATLRRLIRGGLDPNEILVGYPGNRMTPLEWACQYQSSELVQCLIDGGCDISKSLTSRDLLTRFVDHYDGDANEVTKPIDLEVVQLLLRNGINVNPSRDESPLCSAILRGPLEVITVLIAAGADPNFRDPELGGTPISTALYSELPDEFVLDALKILIKAGANLKVGICGNQTDGYTSTLQAAIHRGIRIVKFLLNNGAPVEGCCLELALDHGDMETAKLLLSTGAPITASALEPAMKNAPDELITVLLEHGTSDVAKDRRRIDAYIGAIYSGKDSFIKSFETNKIRLSGSQSLTKAIHSAIKNGHKSTLKLLLDPDSKNYRVFQKSLQGALDVAILSADRDIIDMLLNAGATVKLDSNLNSLSKVIKNRDVDLFRRLLMGGAHVNSYHQSIQLSVLPIAIQEGCSQIIDELLAVDANVNGVFKTDRSTMYHTEYQTPLHAAIQRRDCVMIDRLIFAGADINCYSIEGIWETPLSTAVLKGDSFMVGRLLHLGADPGDVKALCAAVSVSKKLLEELLMAASGRNPPCSPDIFIFALQKAISIGNIQMVNILLSTGADPNKIVRRSRGLTPYTGARYDVSCFGVAVTNVKGQNLDLVKVLLDRGANPNSAINGDRPRQTPLLAAVGAGNVAMVKLLIECGAVVNSLANYGYTRTPLQLAAEKGEIEIIKELLLHSADVNAAPNDDHGATALQFAAIGGYIGIAKLLLDNHADVNFPRAKLGGRTALEAAAEHGRLDMVQLLLNWGVQVTGPGQQQYDKAVEFAKSHGHMAISRVLKKHHAWISNYPQEDYNLLDFLNIDLLI